MTGLGIAVQERKQKESESTGSLEKQLCTPSQWSPRYSGRGVQELRTTSVIIEDPRTSFCPTVVCEETLVPL